MDVAVETSVVLPINAVSRWDAPVGVALDSLPWQPHHLYSMNIPIPLDHMLEKKKVRGGVREVHVNQRHKNMASKRSKGDMKVTAEL